MQLMANENGWDHGRRLSPILQRKKKGNIESSSLRQYSSGKGGYHKGFLDRKKEGAFFPSKGGRKKACEGCWVGRPGLMLLRASRTAMGTTP